MSGQGLGEAVRIFRRIPGSVRGEIWVRLAGVLLAALSAGSGCAGEPDQDNPNIILISLDTTRADRLGCYGYERPTSPNLDRLAAESVVYDRAFATTNWTLPSHASLFTGKFTSSHGARYDPDGPFSLIDAIRGGKIAWSRYRACGLSEGETTLARTLKSRDYITGAVVGGPWLKTVFGLRDGFDNYDDAEISTVNGRFASQITESALRWLEKNRENQFFLFLNYYDPHAPYSPPDRFDQRFLSDVSKEQGGSGEVQRKNALYDAEILYMDHHIGRLLDNLKELNLYASAWIIVTADHGELLGEHGMFGHRGYLAQEELHVPLIIKYPLKEAKTGRTKALVQLIDILPMILQRIGIPLPDGIQGSAPPISIIRSWRNSTPLPTSAPGGTGEPFLTGPSNSSGTAKAIIFSSISRWIRLNPSI